MMTSRSDYLSELDLEVENLKVLAEQAQERYAMTAKEEAFLDIIIASCNKFLEHNDDEPET